MQIIYSENTVDMLPIFEDFCIRRCHVAGCRELPIVVVTGLSPTAPACGFCATHYQQAIDVPTRFMLEFDTYDAFADLLNFADPILR